MGNPTVKASVIGNKVSKLLVLVGQGRYDYAYKKPLALNMLKLGADELEVARKTNVPYETVMEWGNGSTI